MSASFDFQRIPTTLVQMCQSIAQAGGEAWLVGGCVRDLTLGLTPHDWDVEVYQLEPEKLWSTLSNLGHVEHVGKHFGVCKLWLKGLEVDVALPRTEKKTGVGHCAFAVTPDPWISPEQASLRRDFSINALMVNPLEQQLLDFHHGLEDLKQKTLRHVSPAFVEDPLRPLRAMQFAARFQLTLSQETRKMCASLLSEASSLPASRIWQEWLKWAKADTPSYGLQALKDSTWLSLYPELTALMGCPQDDYWHPEGDVWVHTCLVVDAAAKLKGQRDLSQEQQIQLVFAALCHDLGKPSTTLSNAEGKICSPAHAMAGKTPATSLLRRIAAPKSFKTILLPLVQEHITHLHGKASKRAVSRLAHRLQPASIELWEVLTEADASGRTPAPASRPALPWLDKAISLKIQQRQSPALLTGKMLIDAGLTPCADFKHILNAAYQAQLDDEIYDESSALLWLQRYTALD
ncbi:MAG: tRNA nucleotidyltransferase [Mariprofundaceae bacterium]|nr:tRNA nucleotidyltransferase [Mariprofundaceae bacterium]